MTARSERVMISLTVRSKSILERLAAATGKPMATVAGEVIEEAAPMLEMLAKSAEDVKAKKADAYSSVATALAQTQLQAAQLAVDFHSGKGRRKKRHAAR